MRRFVYISAFSLLVLGMFSCGKVWDHNQPPVITSATSTTAVIDLPYSYTTTAEDPNRDVVEYEYSGLPDWLSIDGPTVYGIPDSLGTYEFSVTAKDSEGESDRITVTVEIKSNAGLIESIVAAVSVDSLLDVVNKLSGNSLIHTDDESYFVKTRLTYFEGNELAAKYLEWKLTSFGLLTGRHDFSLRGSNVLALQPGNVFPDSIYIVGAHYDCTVIGNDSRPEDIRNAPGADNNASGVATVLEAARILSQYTCRYSILYVLWDESEYVLEDPDQIGLLGSTAYAEHTLECEMRIAGVIDMDMIAYDYNDDGAMYIHGSPQGRSAWMAERAVDMAERFELRLVPRVTMIGLGTDNVPFYLLGYSTIGFSEDIMHDANHYDHQSLDTVDKFNIDYYHQISKLIVATLAFLTGVESSGSLPPSTFWFCI